MSVVGSSAENVSCRTQKYVVGDALDELDKLDDGIVAVVHLDDAWERPHRDGAFGVEYDTHGLDVTWDILDECYRVLEGGGWLIMDVDDWLLPRAIDYLRETWGDVNATYSGGGYRKIGGVVYVNSDGDPDRRPPGKYYRNAGYPVVFAHKGETGRQSYAAARQLARKVAFDYDWGTVKPIEPYENWLQGITNPGDLLVEPCAGTAPASIAMQRLYGKDARYVAIDNQEGAFDEFQRRLTENGT